MWKKHRYTILSFVLMVGIFLTGLRLQQFADAAGPATDNKTGSPAVKEHKITFVQGGKELDLDTNPALKIDLTSELTVTIKDKFNFNKNDATGHIDDNSYVEYELGQYFDITNTLLEEYTKPDPHNTPPALLGKTICKTTFKKEVDGKIKVRFDFSFADSEMFNQNEIEVNAVVKLKVNQDEIKTTEAGGKVKILGKAYGVESSGEEFTVNKEGKLNLNNGTVDWTVDVLRKKKGLNEQLSLAGYVFNDNLKDVVGEYEVNTFKINGNQKDLDNGNRTNLTYTIKNDDCTVPNIGTAKIEFSTLITKDDLFRGRTYKNKAKVFKENSVIESNEAKVELKKFGDKHGEVKKENDKQYIEWCIVINEDNKELENVIIEDPLMVSQLGNVPQTRKESFYQVWDNIAGKWEDTKHDITPESDNKYKLNNITKKLRLTIITNPFDTDGGYYEFKNDAKIFWGSSSVHRVILDDSKAIGRGKLRKEAVTYGLSTGETETKGDRRKNEAGDIKRAGFETEWRSKVTISDTDNQKYYLYDAFVFGKGIKANNAELGDTSKYIVTNLDGTTTNIRNGVDLSKVVYKDIYHQRLVNPENPLSYNPKNLTSKVYLIKKKDDNTTIGHLLEISGFGKGENEVGFKSKIVETWMVISQDSADSPSEVRNFMFLEKEDGTVIEERTAKAKYNTKILSKQALSKEAATEFVKNLTVSSSNNIVNDDVFDSTAKKAKASDEIKESAFNIKDRSIIYRLSVNAGKINDTDGDFGVFTVTDKLPDGWELVPIKDDKEYLIYKGSPATSVAKIDATVLAEGSPIDLPAEKLNFLKTNNKLEFKFTNLDSPYVILFKLQIKEDKFKEYINTKNNTVNNEAEITAESTSYNKVLNRWLNHTVKSSQEAIINEEFLTKTYDANAQEQEKKDYLKWDIIYTPYKNYPDNTKVRLEDKFGDKLSIRKEQDGSTLVFQGNNYRIFTGKINAEGIFEEQYEITTGLSDIFKYDKNTKQLIIDLPDSNETYKISYITDILGDINAGIGLGNEVYLREGMAAATTVKVEKTYEAKVASSGKVKGFEKLTIIKKNVNGDKLLSGAKFTLTKNSTEVGGSPKTTDAEGKISFEKLLAGEYVLKEVQAPDGYQLNTTEYKIKITDLENGKKVELLDNAGNPVVKLGNATQNGNEITITNELKPENKTNLGKLKIVKKSENGLRLSLELSLSYIRVQTLLQVKLK